MEFDNHYLMVGNSIQVDSSEREDGSMETELSAWTAFWKLRFPTNASSMGLASTEIGPLRRNGRNEVMGLQSVLSFRGQVMYEYEDWISRLE